MPKIPSDDPENLDLYQEIINTAQEFGVDPSLPLAIAHHESGFNPKARSPVGASGVLQLMPETAKRFGVKDPFNPRENIRGGVQYLRFLLDRYRTTDDPVSHAIAGYHAGEGNIDKYGLAYPGPKTQNYLKNVRATRDQLFSKFGGAFQSQSSPQVNQQAQPQLVDLLQQPGSIVDLLNPPQSPDVQLPGPEADVEEVKAQIAQAKPVSVGQRRVLKVTPPKPSAQQTDNTFRINVGRSRRMSQGEAEFASAFEQLKQQGDVEGASAKAEAMRSFGWDVRYDVDPKTGIKWPSIVPPKGLGSPLGQPAPQKFSQGTEKFVQKEAPLPGRNVAPTPPQNPIARVAAELGGGKMMETVGGMISGLGTTLEDIPDSFRDRPQGFNAPSHSNPLTSFGRQMSSVGQFAEEGASQNPVAQFGRTVVGMLPYGALPQGVGPMATAMYLESRGRGVSHEEALKHTASSVAGLVGGGAVGRNLEQQVESTLGKYLTRAGSIGTGIEAGSVVNNEPQTPEDIAQRYALGGIFALQGIKPKAKEASTETGLARPQDVRQYNPIVSSERITEVPGARKLLKPGDEAPIPGQEIVSPEAPQPKPPKTETPQDQRSEISRINEEYRQTTENLKGQVGSGVTYAQYLEGVREAQSKRDSALSDLQSRAGETVLQRAQKSTYERPTATAERPQAPEVVVTPEETSLVPRQQQSIPFRKAERTAEKTSFARMRLLGKEDAKGIEKGTSYLLPLNPKDEEEAGYIAQGYKYKPNANLNAWIPNAVGYTAPNGRNFLSPSAAQIINSKFNHGAEEGVTLSPEERQKVFQGMELDLGDEGLPLNPKAKRAYVELRDWLKDLDAKNPGRDVKFTTYGLPEGTVSKMVSVEHHEQGHVDYKDLTNELESQYGMGTRPIPVEHLSKTVEKTKSSSQALSIAAESLAKRYGRSTIFTPDGDLTDYAVNELNSHLNGGTNDLKDLGFDIEKASDFKRLYHLSKAVAQAVELGHKDKPVEVRDKIHESLVKSARPGTSRKLRQGAVEDVRAKRKDREAQGVRPGSEGGQRRSGLSKVSGVPQRAEGALARVPGGVPKTRGQQLGLPTPAAPDIQPSVMAEARRISSARKSSAPQLKKAEKEVTPAPRPLKPNVYHAPTITKGVEEARKGGGYTFTSDLQGTYEGNKGYVVTLTSEYVPAKDLKGTDVIKFRNKWLGVLRNHPDTTIGVFHMGDDDGPHKGEVSLDFNTIVHDRDTAVKLGGPRFFNQKAIWDLEKSDVVETGGDGTPRITSAPEIEKTLQEIQNPNFSVASVPVVSPKKLDSYLIKQYGEDKPEGLGGGHWILADGRITGAVDHPNSARMALKSVGYGTRIPDPRPEMVRHNGAVRLLLNSRSVNVEVGGRITIPQVETIAKIVRDNPQRNFNYDIYDPETRMALSSFNMYDQGMRGMDGWASFRREPIVQEADWPQFKVAPALVVKVDPFYSGMAKALEREMKDGENSVDDVKRLLFGSKGSTPAKGVKQDEVKWSGIEKFLEGKKTVTKEEVARFLAENSPRLSETTFGPSLDPEVRAKEKQYDAANKAYLEANSRATKSYGKALEAVEEGLQRIELLDFDQPSPEPELYDKAKRYGLFGPADRSQIYNALNNKNGDVDLMKKIAGARAKDIDDYLKVKAESEKAYKTLYGPEFSGRPTMKEPQYGFVTQPLGQGENYREVIIQWPGKTVFESPHFGETGSPINNDEDEFEPLKNPIVHFRVDERVDGDGHRILFIHEIQDEHHNEVAATKSELKKYQATGGVSPSGRNPASRLRELEDILPFRGKSHELALKRILRYAVENGFEGIAWTTGEQQRERNSLSSVIDQLDWSVKPGGKLFTLTGYSEGNQTFKKEVTKDELPGTIGAQLAQKIEDQSTTQAGGSLTTDLEIGGEGKDQYYDVMIPSFLKKYTAQWGASVSSTTVTTGSDILQIRSRSQDQEDKIVGTISLSKDADTSPEGIAQILRDEGYNRAGWGPYYGKLLPKKTHTVHKLKFTPAMESVVTEGQPMWKVSSDIIAHFYKPLGKDRASLLEVGKHLQGLSEKRLKTLPPGTSRGRVLRRVVDVGMLELKHQLEQENSGADWYVKDIDDLDQGLRDLYPSIKDDNNQLLLFKALTAVTSAGAKPPDNIRFASKLYEEYLKTGHIPPRQPNGKQWTPKTQPTHLSILDRMVNELGVADAMKLLSEDHKVGELKKWNPNGSGLSGGKDKIVPGSFVFGPKFGPFFLNISRIRPTSITKDLWFTRTWNRWMGTILDPSGEIHDVPRSDAERDLMDEAVQSLRRELKAEGKELDESAIQAALWYKEQQLWKHHGAKVESYSYRDAIERLYERKGKTFRSERDAETGPGVDRLGADAQRRTTGQGSAKGPTGVPAETQEAPIQPQFKIVHKQFGTVVKDEDQSGVAKGHLRVKDESGDTHVIKTVGKNQYAVAVAEAPEIPHFKIIHAEGRFAIAAAEKKFKEAQQKTLDAQDDLANSPIDFHKATAKAYQEALSEESKAYNELQQAKTVANLEKYKAGKAVKTEAQALRDKLNAKAEAEGEKIFLSELTTLDKYYDTEGKERPIQTVKREYVEKFGPLVGLTIADTQVVVGQNELEDALAGRPEMKIAPAKPKLHLVKPQQPQFRAAQNNVVPTTQVSKKELLVSLYKTGLLSSPHTSAVNITSNTLFQGAEELARGPAVIFDWLMSKKSGFRSVTAPTVSHVFNRQAWREAYDAAKKTLKQGVTPQQAAAYNLPSNFTSGHPILDAFIKFSTNVYSAQDNFFKAFAIRRTMEEMSYTEALKELRAGTIKRNQLSSRKEEIFNGINVAPSTRMAMENYATQVAAFVTFTDRNLVTSKIDSVVEDWSQAVGEWLKTGYEFLAPFRNTPANIVVRSLDYTPVGATLRALGVVRDYRKTKQWTPDLQRRIAMAGGRGTVGLGIILLGFAAAAAGVGIGVFGRDHKKRRLYESAGIVEGSVKVGDKWINLSSLGPVGALFAVGATVHDLWMEDQASLDKKSAEKQATGARVLRLGAKALTDSVISQHPLMAPAKDLLEAPEKDFTTTTTNIAKNKAASFVPSIIRDVAKMTDSKEREATTVTQAIEKNIPGLRQTLPVKKDVLGRDLERPLGERTSSLFLRTGSASKDTPALSEMRRLHITPGYAQPKGGEAKQDTKARTAERDAKRGPVLEALVGSEKYRGLSDDQKQGALRKVLSSSKAQELKGDSELTQKFIDQVVQSVKFNTKKKEAIEEVKKSEPFKRLSPDAQQKVVQRLKLQQPTRQ